MSAPSPPFVVSLAAERGAGGLSGLGPFIIASGFAGIIGGRASGRLADRSSRNLMTRGAGIAALILIAMLSTQWQTALGDSSWLFVATFFLLTLTHTGVRVARKTYVVDMATGDEPTDYVAVSNTLMGMLLLVTGALSSALAQIDISVALLFLAGLGITGVLVAQSLPDVSKDADASSS